MYSREAYIVYIEVYIEREGWRDVPKLTMRQHEWKRPARAGLFVKQSLSRTVVPTPSSLP